jgi:hypothetical protein
MLLDQVGHLIFGVTNIANIIQHCSAPVVAIQQADNMCAVSCKFTAGRSEYTPYRT